MRRKILPILLLAGTAFASRFDALILLQLPAQAETGGTITLGAVDMINDLSPANAPADSLVRDSLHFGLGLPAGWSVSSVTIHPAFDFRPSRASVNRLDTNYRNELLRDSMEAYASQGAALSADAGLHGFVQGRTFRVHASPDSLGKVLIVKADTVAQWFGFSGRIGLSIPAGVAADTVLGGNALKQIPVFIYAVLHAGSQAETVKPVFLAKTGPLDTTANLLDQLLGYRPVTVSAPTAILAPARAWPSLSITPLRDPLGRAPGARRPASAIFFPLP